MICPRCRLDNPDSALRCDCGYDFERRTVDASYAPRALPATLRGTLVIATVLQVAALAGVTYRIRPPSGATDVSLLGVSMIVACLYVAAVAYLYDQLVRRKNWARLALICATFPGNLVVWAVLRQLLDEARIYCMQLPTKAVVRSIPRREPSTRTEKRQEGPAEATASGRSVGQDPDRLLTLLRDGDQSEQIWARFELAKIFEGRGLLREALECYETNDALGACDLTCRSRMVELRDQLAARSQE